MHTKCEYILYIDLWCRGHFRIVFTKCKYLIKVKIWHTYINIFKMLYIFLSCRKVDKIETSENIYLVSADRLQKKCPIWNLGENRLLTFRLFIFFYKNKWYRPRVSSHSQKLMEISVDIYCISLRYFNVPVNKCHTH